MFVDWSSMEPPTLRPLASVLEATEEGKGMDEDEMSCDGDEGMWMKMDMQFAAVVWMSDVDAILDI